MKDRRFRRNFDLPDREEVAALLRRYRGTHLEARTRLLYEVTHNPGIPVESLMRAIERSRRTVGRYLQILRNEGYKALLNEKGGGRKLTREQIDILVARVRSGALLSIRYACRWVEREFGVSYSVQGLNELIGKEIKIARRIVEHRAASVEAGDTVPIDLVNLLNLMNRTPRTLDLSEYVRQMREGLREFLPGALNVVIYVNTTSYLGETTGTVPSASLLRVESVKEGAESMSSDDLLVQGTADVVKDQDLVSSIQETMIEQKKYDPASQVNVVREFRVAEDEMIGFAIVTLPKGGEDAKVARLLDQLAPYITTAIFNASLRSRYQETKNRESFHEALLRLASRKKLTPREREVLLLYVRGNSTQTIADLLSIANSTVEKHITSIHKKTGRHSAADIVTAVHESSL